MADKKYRITQDNSQYGEMEVEWENGVRLILTDAKRIYSDDWNSIKGWVVDCTNEDGNEFIPEYLYSLSFMPDGYSLTTYIVDEDVAKKVITDNVINILHHGGNGLKDYLEELNNKLNFSGGTECL
ncbi:MAG: hypothetical protein K2L82_14155 [Lachnospiraceae bacterium]|nr:hypothetical protein [Lachnospiraceae bacterium]